MWMDAVKLIATLMAAGSGAFLFCALTVAKRADEQMERMQR